MNQVKSKRKGLNIRQTLLIFELGGILITFFVLFVDYSLFQTKVGLNKFI